jgi:YegS/Rv2252/BmrU family lipid kinase
VKLSIIANPVAGRRRPYRKIARLVDRWPHRDWTVDLHPTRCPEHAGEIAHELLSDPPGLLAVCGGDGTLHEVASRVPNPPFPVAILPAGTGNVLAHELNLPMNPIKALDIALNCEVQHVDLGLLKARQNHRFLLMAGIGFDAYVASKVRTAMKTRIGIAAFYLETFRALASYAFPHFQVHVGDETLQATSCLVANAHSYGGGLVITPDADMCDGIFDVLVLQKDHRLSYAKFLLSAWLGKPPEFPGIERRRAAEVKIEGRRGPWVQADGELVGTLPLEISLSRAAFPLVVRG